MGDLLPLNGLSSSGLDAYEGFSHFAAEAHAILRFHNRAIQKAVKEFIRKLLSTTGYTLVKISFLEMIRKDLAATQGAYELLRTSAKSLPHVTFLLEDIKRKDNSIGIVGCIEHSRAQLAQDLFVLNQLHGNQKARFFVEFGATDGVTLSNTHLLEKHFGWKGILAEPARCWHHLLAANRSCIIDHRCVYNETGIEVDFLEVDQDSSSALYVTPELSGIADYADNGDWASPIRRDHSTRYPVETVTLDDLLVQHNAPYEIGYLSIDTEGSELEILQAFDFKSRMIHVITVEHNYQDDIRSGLYKLLVRNGFKRVFEDISGWDDWYVASGS